MEVFSEGVALIKNKETGQKFEIDSQELQWEVVSAHNRDMGQENHYRAQINHPVLGYITWNLWEYPTGVQNFSETQAFPNVVINDFVYNLTHEGDFYEYYGEFIDEIFQWFFDNYEDPAYRTPYDKESGYLYEEDGPYNAWDVISNKFPDMSDDILLAAKAEIEADGILEWAVISNGVENLDEKDEITSDNLDLIIEKSPQSHPEIPKQSAGLSFETLRNGKISLKASGLTDDKDQDEIADLLEILKDSIEELINELNGSNAHAPLFEIAKRYQTVLLGEILSIDQLYAFGVRVENTHKRLKDEINNEGYPDLPTKAGEALDSALSIHGIVIASTKRGKKLLNRLKVYTDQNLEIDKIKHEAQNLSEKISQSTEMLTQETNDLITEINNDIGEGPNPNRSTQIALTTNNNLLITIAKILVKPVGTVIATSFALSEPGSLLFGAGSEAITSMWVFITENISSLMVYAKTAGPQTSWLINFLNWIKSKRPK